MVRIINQNNRAISHRRENTPRTIPHVHPRALGSSRVSSASMALGRERNKAKKSGRPIITLTCHGHWKAHKLKTMMARPRLQSLGQAPPPSPLPLSPERRHHDEGQTDRQTNTHRQTDSRVFLIIYQVNFSNIMFFSSNLAWHAFRS